MGDTTPLEFPNDVVDWVTSTFRLCNIRISEKLTNNPNLPEESLDLTWIEHFSQFASPITLNSEWTIKVETHFLGGLRHFQRWEIADIGILLFVRQAGRITRSKVALLQSKRLYPTTNQVREERLIDYRTGFARLADPEDLRTSISIQSEFNFNNDCRFNALVANSDQAQAIHKYEQEHKLLVYYQFYSPWTVPFVQRIPLSDYTRPNIELTHGVRVMRASTVHDFLQNQADGHRPTLSELQTVSGIEFPCGWPLDFFAGELFLKCKEGSIFETIADQRIQNLFYRRSGPIAAAIAITIEEPTGRVVP